MDQEKKTHLDRINNPVFQALLTFSGVLLVNLSARIVDWAGIMEIGNRFPWMVAASFMLCFALFNSVLSLSAKSMVKYWGASVYSFMGLASTSGFLAWAISSISISEAGSYRWIFMVVTIGYLVFLSMMAFLRTIVEFAQREEWNQPRLRNRSRNKDK